MKQYTTACVDCNACVEACMALQQNLLQTSSRRHCPTSQILSDFYLGLLAAAKAAKTQDHLAECPYCPVELAELAQFLETFGG